ncbi:MAG: GFA family protein [Pseudomonadota bacterium]
MKITDHGNRGHFGAVAFDADMDLAGGTRGRNGSTRTRTRAGGGFVPPDAFRRRRGKEALPGHRTGACSMHSPFCRHRRARPFGMDHLDDVEAPLAHGNGSGNDGMRPPAGTRHL